MNLKKGDKVKLILKNVKKKAMDFQSIGTKKVGGPLANVNLHPQIVEHATLGDIGTVTAVTHQSSYLNLKFDDGFECGVDAEDAIVVGKI